VAKADKEKVQVEEVSINSFDELPDIDKKEYKVMREGKVYKYTYTPLSYAKQEQVKADYPMPTPPLKEITDEKERLKRTASKMPLAEPDPEDPKYKEDLEKATEKRSLAQVLIALGWDMPLDKFETVIQSKLNTAELLAFAGEVQRNSYQISPLLVDSFFLS
jgi:isopenicillin N synthase-like dioxygenase